MFCLCGALLACQKSPRLQESDSPSVQAQEPVPPKADLSLEKVQIPLRVPASASNPEQTGKASIALLKVGAGKRGGIMKVLHPAVRADSVEVLTEGEDLRILADFPNGVKTLIALPDLEIRGLRVLTSRETSLLECAHARVSAGGEWSLRGITLAGGTFIPHATLTFSEDGSMHWQTGASKR